eukprot:m.265729 g.265729  ORF g.265729 m.265729 type:complete len:75 (+) comp40493_c2_seq7:60-284(+)
MFSLQFYRNLLFPTHTHTHTIISTKLQESGSNIPYFSLVAAVTILFSSGCLQPLFEKAATIRFSVYVPECERLP